MRIRDYFRSKAKELAPENEATETRMHGDSEPDLKKLALENDVIGLIQASNHTDKKIRKEAVDVAVDVFSRITDPSATTHLIQAMQTGRGYRMTEAAANAINNIGNPKAFDPVIKVSQKSRFAPLYLKGLDYAVNIDYIDKIIPLLKNEDTDIHKWATEALGRIGASGIPFVIKALKEGEWGSQQSYRAEKALEKIGARAAPFLIEALNDTSERIRKIAANVLGKVGNNEAIEPLIKSLQDESIRIKVIFALSKIGDERAIKPIMDYLGDDDAHVRNTVAKALEHLDRDQFLDIAIDTYAKNSLEEDWQVQNQALFLLGETKSQNAVAPLVRALREEKELVVREEAFLALRKIVPEKEIPNMI